MCVCVCVGCMYVTLVIHIMKQLKYIKLFFYFCIRKIICNNYITFLGICKYIYQCDKGTNGEIICDIYEIHILVSKSYKQI